MVRWMCVVRHGAQWTSCGRLERDDLTMTALRDSWIKVDVALPNAIQCEDCAAAATGDPDPNHAALGGSRWRDGGLPAAPCQRPDAEGAITTGVLHQRGGVGAAAAEAQLDGSAPWQTQDLDFKVGALAAHVERPVGCGAHAARPGHTASGQCEQEEAAGSAWLCVLSVRTCKPETRRT